MGALILFLAAFLWGSAFVAQKLAAGHMGPFAVLFFRNLVGGVFLLAVCFASRRGIRAAFTRKAALGGLVCGILLFFASLCQQIGIECTTPGISAFLTCNYLVLVPVFWFLAHFAGLGGRARPPRGVLAAVALALAGSYLLCVAPGESFRLGRGEAWTLLCAALFALQILAVDRFAPGTDIFAFSCLQQFAGTACSLPFLALASERAHYTLADVSAAFWPLMYIAVFSSGIAFTCQNYGQMRCPPVLAAIVMSLESAIGALCGWICLGDALSARQAAGCAILFFAVVFSQVASAMAAGKDRKECR